VKKPVKFDNPPVTEVACSVLFSLPQPLKSTFVGLYWQAIRRDFPKIDEAPPVPPAFESPIPGHFSASFQFGNLPAMRRHWFSNADATRLIQVQEDRFIFNWKKAPSDLAYPSYEVVMKEFEDHFAQFTQFLKSENLGTPTPRQYELVYTNFVTPQNGLDEVSKTGLLVDHIPDSSRERFLPQAEMFNWVTSYPLPDNWGRLHIQGQTAIAPPALNLIIRLDLIARGIPPNQPEVSRRAWFDLAHEYITHGFADSTAPVLHSDRFWKRTS